MLASAFTALLVCLPYLLSQQELLQQTASRGGGTWNYATTNEFTFIDSIGSLLFPPAAAVEGLFFFGILGLLFILLYLFGGFSSIQSAGKFHTGLFEDKWVKLFLYSGLSCSVWLPMANILSFLLFFGKSCLFSNN